MKTEKEKMTGFHFNEIRDELKRQYDPYMIERFLNIIYDEGLEAEKSEVIKQIMEIIDNDCWEYKKNVNRELKLLVEIRELKSKIDKLVEEQTSGELAK